MIAVSTHAKVYISHPQKSRYYYLLGYGGNGTVYSMLGSELLADLIHGRENPLAGLLKIGR